jgi:hypothetical protein
LSDVVESALPRIRNGKTCMSPEEMTLIDAARGDTPRGVWIRDAALAAARGEEGEIAPLPVGYSKGGARKITTNFRLSEVDIDAIDTAAATYSRVHGAGLDVKRCTWIRMAALRRALSLR